MENPTPNILREYIKKAKEAIDTACDYFNYAMITTADTLDLRDEKLALREVYDKLTEKYYEYMTERRNNNQ